MNTGVNAAAAWLARFEVVPDHPRWSAAVVLEATRAGTLPLASRLSIEIYTEEWGVVFEHRGEASWIRVTDVEFVHGRDDFELVGRIPRLDSISTLIRDIEREHGLVFDRQRPFVRSSFGAYDTIAGWARSL